MLLDKRPIAATNATPTNKTNSAYSTRSCPSSFPQNLETISVMKYSPARDFYSNRRVSQAAKQYVPGVQKRNATNVVKCTTKVPFSN